MYILSDQSWNMLVLFGIAVQNTMQIVLKAARLVTRLTRSVHLDCLYKEAGQGSLISNALRKSLKTLHRFTYGFMPIYLQDLLPLLVDDSQ